MHTSKIKINNELQTNTFVSKCIHFKCFSKKYNFILHDFNPEYFIVSYR